MAFAVGFPLVTARAAMGLTDRLDVGVGFNSLYGIMNEPLVFTRYGLLGGERAYLAASLEAGWASFLQGPSNEGHGARWMTGRRNYNISPGLVFSVEGGSPRSARFFFDVRYLVAIDTQPFQKNPLAGIPRFATVSGNVPVRGGVEIPFSEVSSFLVNLGFDVHGRVEDSSFMPTVAVGLVTSL